MSMIDLEDFVGRCTKCFRIVVVNGLTSKWCTQIDEEALTAIWANEAPRKRGFMANSNAGDLRGFQCGGTITPVNDNREWQDAALAALKVGGLEALKQMLEAWYTTPVIIHDGKLIA